MKKLLLLIYFAFSCFFYVESVYAYADDSIEIIKSTTKLINTFGFDLYNEFANNSPHSFYFSPYSIYTLFSDIFKGDALNDTIKYDKEDDIQDFSKLKETIERTGYILNVNKLCSSDLYLENRFKIYMGPLSGSGFRLVNLDFSLNTQHMVFRLDGKDSLKYIRHDAWLGLKGNYGYLKTEKLEILRGAIGSSGHSMVIVMPLNVDDLYNIYHVIGPDMFSKLILNMDVEERIIVFPYPFNSGIRNFDLSKAVQIFLSRTPAFDRDVYAKFLKSKIANIYHNINFFVQRDSLQLIIQNLALADFHLTTIDRPFLYFVIDDLTDCILLIGRYVG
jgi:serine protease inhibitor